jgi:hypothetical protein
MVNERIGYAEYNIRDPTLLGTAVMLYGTVLLPPPKNIITTANRTTQCHKPQHLHKNFKHHLSLLTLRKRQLTAWVLQQRSITNSTVGLDKPHDTQYAIGAHCHAKVTDQY